SVGLINMNARLYDPLLHRFLQADNYIQDPTNTQNYNQYGYVLNNPLLYTDPSGNKYGDGKDCIGCNSDNGELSNGQQTLAGNAIKSIANNWEEWGIKDWAKQNLNFKSWGRSWNKFWGKNGGHDSNPAPQPNLSKYQNITANQIKPIPGMVDKNALEKWTNLPLFERLTTSQPENPYMIANSGGLEFITGEAEFLLLAKGGEKVYEVYHLVNKETKAVEYVGKTGQGIFKRFDQHMLEPAKQAWIHNVEPVLFKGGLSRFGAKYYEQTEILTYKLENLYNKINAVAEKYWIKYRIKK
ncbi:MAG: RHS repeat-associated core domain-containing protein, partial [Flavobacterium sp.]